MRLHFLTACLEPGRDGVGDYTRLLAGECAREGHEVTLIALQDPHVADVVQGIESLDNRDVCVLRLPAQLPWARRTVLVRELPAPDWISLQFVAYAFHPKGVVSGVTPHLKKITEGSRLHIMFHELWIGTGPLASFRHRLVGMVQRFQLKRMIRALAPQVVTVTNPFYGALLKKLGSISIELALFGNIPVAPVMETVEPGFSLGIFFGTLHPEWEPEPFMSQWLSACVATGKEPRLVSLGRMGPAGDLVWQKLQTDYAGRVDFVALGEVPASIISSWLQRADFGLAASPWHLIGKSGSAVAMLEHGLPVIVTRDEFRSEDASDESHDALLHRCDERLKSKLMAGLPKRTPGGRLAETGRKFIQLLEAASG